jgi:hypothetical protein
MYKSAFGSVKHCPQRVSGLHLAAFFGLNLIVKTLLDSGASVDARDGLNRTPHQGGTPGGILLGLRPAKMAMRFKPLQMRVISMLLRFYSQQERMFITTLDSTNQH